MLSQTLPGIWQSDKIAGIDNIFHAFSGRRFGDMRLSESRYRFADACGFSGAAVVLHKQVHGKEVFKAKIGSTGQSGYDASVYRFDPENIHGKDYHPVLSVSVADCIPLVIVDPQAGVIAAVHSGWRGTIGRITGQTLKEMVKLGARPDRLYAAVGPHIGVCCYDVPAGRAAAFKRSFSGTPDIIEERSGKNYIRMSAAIKTTLREGGIPESQIDISTDCTSCNDSFFYSFRKRRHGLYGMMIGVITFKS